MLSARAMVKEIYPTDHRTYLLAELDARVSRRPAYSKRAFARDLKVSPASLTEFLSGKTTFSPARIKAISEIIRLESEQANHWLDLVTLHFADSESSKAKAKTRISARLRSMKAEKALQKYQVASRWECWAYLELLEIDAKAQDDKYAAKWLSISLKELLEIQTQMLDIGILEYSSTSEKKLQRSNVADVFGGETPSSAVRAYHRGLLSKARLALDEQAFDKRFFSSVIFSLPSSKLKALFTEIENKIYEPLIEISSAKEKDAIYCFSFQLYDLKDGNQNEPKK